MEGSFDETPGVSAPVEAPRQIETFEDMNLSEGVHKALTEMGFTVPMEVQKQVFAGAMAGQDLMVQARTGSGKTAAFGIPFAQGLVKPGVHGVQAICLCPTRELALQVANELARILAFLDIGVVAVYGGAPMNKQIDALKAGVQIVVGTPGRVLDHIRRGNLKLDNCKIAVLDECDEMLSMGFLEDIEKILSSLPPKDKRQTLLFSATIPPDIERIGGRYMNTPKKVQASDKNLAPAEITHSYYMVNGPGRLKDLWRVLEVERPESAIIFCNTRDETSVVAAYLSRQGFDAEAISSDLSQSERERVMNRTKAKTLHYLVATDIAARGIDISDLTHVINFTFPESAEVYIHRTGRTGRAGKKGAAISLIAPRELGNFYYLKLITKLKPEERQLPTDEELRTRREAERWQKVSAAIAGEPGDEWRALARRALTTADGERVLAELLRRTVEATGGAAASGFNGEQRRPDAMAAAAAAPATLDGASPSTLGGVPPSDVLRSERSGPREGGRGRERRGHGDRDRGGRGGAGRGEGPRGRGPRRDMDSAVTSPLPVRDAARATPPEVRAEMVGMIDPAPAFVAAETADQAEQEWSDGQTTLETVVPPEMNSVAPLGGSRERTSRRRRPGPAEGFRDARPDEGSARGGDRGGARDRERGRGGRDRGPRPERGAPRDGGAPREGRHDAAGPPRDAAALERERQFRKPEPVAPLQRPADDPREFWEAWVDERTRRVEPADAAAAAGAPPPAPESSPPPAEEARPDDPNQPVRLYLNLGRRDGATDLEIEELILERTGLTEDDLPKIQVRETHTYVHVQPALVDRVVPALHGHRYGTRDLICERARK